MEAEIRYGYESSWIDKIFEIYNKTEMKRSDKRKVDQAFKNSFVVASCWLGSQIVGVGRMISDGEMYSGIFDVVIDPQYQKNGFGKKIMEALIAKVPNTCIHLTSTFGNEAFYYNLGFQKHRTAMALYPSSMSGSKYLDREWKP